MILSIGSSDFILFAFIMSILFILINLYLYESIYKLRKENIQHIKRIEKLEYKMDNVQKFNYIVLKELSRSEDEKYSSVNKDNRTDND